MIRIDTDIEVYLGPAAMEVDDGDGGMVCRLGAQIQVRALKGVG